jgi:hypothetical protein
MAGIAVPTAFLLVAMTVFTIARYVYDVPLQIERVIVYPMAVVPNAWGLWNMLYLPLASRRWVPLGIHGALLLLLIAPLAFAITRAIDFAIPSFFINALPIVFPVAIAVYYLVWKHLIGFLNNLLGIA